MKFLLCFIYLLFTPFILFSQQKYFSYSFNNLYGITSVDGKNIIEAKYTDQNEFAIDSMTILKNNTGKTVLFNLYNGKITEFDEIIPNKVFVENEYFSLIKNNGKIFLKGENTGLIINLDKDYYSIENLGPHHILGKVKKIEKTVKTTTEKLELKTEYFYRKDSKGKILPLPTDPKKEPNAFKKVKETSTEKVMFYENFFIFKNSKKLQLQKEINSIFGTIFTIKNKANEKKYDSLATITMNKYSKIKVWNHFLNEEFDYLILIDDYKKRPNPDLKSIIVYDKDLKIIKNFDYKSNNSIEDISDYDFKKQIEKELELLYKKKIIIEKTEFFGYKDANVEPSDIPKKEFIVIENKNGINHISFLNTNNDYTFMFKTPFDVNFNGDFIKIIDNNKNEIKTRIDQANPKLNLPIKYIEMFIINENKQ